MDDRRPTSHYFSRAIGLTCGVLLLLAGGLIYLTFRERNLLMFHLADWLGLGNAVDTWRAHTAHLTWPEWAVYNLPCALWTIAYILVIDSLMRPLSIKARLIWASVVPLLGAGSECLQAIGWLPGTFDAIDLACYTLPYIILIIILYSYTDSENIKKDCYEQQHG